MTEENKGSLFQTSQPQGRSGHASRREPEKKIAEPFEAQGLPQRSEGTRVFFYFSIFFLCFLGFLSSELGENLGMRSYVLTVNDELRVTTLRRYDWMCGMLLLISEKRLRLRTA